MKLKEIRSLIEQGRALYKARDLFTDKMMEQWNSQPIADEKALVRYYEKQFESTLSDYEKTLLNEWSD